MKLAHKIALVPTPEQEEYFRRASDVARFVYNWGLEKWKELYEAGDKPSWISLSRLLTQEKKKNFPWMYEVDAQVLVNALMDLGKAFSHFFRRVKQGEQPGYPKFKKKGNRDSFRITNKVLGVNGKKIWLAPKKFGIRWVKAREELRFKGKIMGATISRDANRWFISIYVDVGNYTKPREKNGKVGIDLGVIHLAVTSDGQFFDAPRPLKAKLHLLRKKSRQLGKKQEGSNNWEKAKVQLAKLYRRIKNIRQDFLHKTTTQLCRENQTIVIKDLDVKGMLSNRVLSRTILDMGLNEFRRQLTYKTQIYQSELLVVDRWFASSKTCSECGWKNDNFKLTERVFKCIKCGLKLDRDVNAAINIFNYPEAQGK